MDPIVTGTILSLVAGVFVSIISNWGYNFLNRIYSVFAPKEFVTITIGDTELKIDSISKDEMNVLVEKIVELQRQPQIFIAYAHEDSDFVHRLSVDLRKNGFKLWIDHEQIKVGDSITSKFEEGITRSQWILLIVSDKLLNSTWVSSELAFALKEEKERKRSIILPVIHKSDQLPEGLIDRFYADFKEDYDHGLRQLLYTLKIEKAEG